MRRLVSAAALILAFAAPSPAASLLDPRYRFRALATEHFIIYFHQDEGGLASRLAAIAEDVWHALERPLGARPPRLTHVVLVDQSDLANGGATPVPRDTIVVTAVWPPGADFIGKTDDWLRLVFTHEFTHIVHLDRSESWARVVRGIFGRTPIAFPNLFLPIWQIEGIATYEESALTGGGRLHAGDFRAIVDEAARAHRVEPLDRVNGGLTDWPDGLAPYAYGLGFHKYLADQYGADKFAALAEATARRVPYTASRVFKRIYGRSLGTLWREYEASLVPTAREPATLSAERLTRDGFVAAGPRFAPARCPTCAAEVLYSMRTPHDFPALNRLTLDGSAPQRVVRKYLGSTLAIGRDTVYFDQQELRRSVGLYSDLYALDRATGHVRQVTRDARIVDPDLSPDQRTIAAARVRPGQRDLVLVRLNPDAPSSYDLITLVSEPETQFNSPRWSPDGRTIAAERHRPGALSEVVAVDVDSRRIRVLASDPATRWVTPAWRPDGRAIIAAADFDDGPFNLYEVGVEDGARPRKLSETTGGAIWPDVSPDGKSIVYVGFTADGFDLFRMAYPAAIQADLRVGPAMNPSDVGADLRGRAQAADTQVGRYDLSNAAPYSPWTTLPPTSWSPIVESDANQVRVGAAISGFDVLGYHGYAASATWLVSRPADAPAVRAAEPDWHLAYAYARWQPTFWASASNETSFFGGPPSDAGVPSTATLRERQVQAGVLLPIVHVRARQNALASLVRAVDEFTFPDRTLSRDRTAARMGWSIATAHSYGYSISPERGAMLGVTGELVRRSLGADADATAGAVDGRMYLPGLARHHVLAIRLAGGASTGDRSLGRVFLLGGGGSNLDPLDFGHEAISLLRGFPTDTFAGTHVALLNADYRWPLARPERGFGTWPLFVHTIHAAVFADAGHAWTRAFNVRDAKTSVGGELSFNLIAGYSIPFNATVGAAYGHDGSGTIADRGTVYFRVGRAF